MVFNPGFCFVDCLYVIKKFFAAPTAIDLFCFLGVNPKALIYWQTFAAYIIERNVPVIGWESAQSAFVNILKQQGRQAALDSIEETCKFVE